jgi:glycosyltransferase involved in cell wall biosynthesis
MNATSDRRKGFQALYPALKMLNQEQWQARIQLVIFGSSQPQNPPDFGFPTQYLGKLNDDIALSLVYSAADVFVAPSQEDNLPNTVLESLACGTPCVAFNIGGMPDLIEHQKNGYLAQPCEIKDLAHGIQWILDNTEQVHQLRDRARKKVETEFNQTIQTQRYLSLFNNIINP